MVLDVPNEWRVGRHHEPQSSIEVDFQRGQRTAHQFVVRVYRRQHRELHVANELIELADIIESGAGV
jgi:hypothetical protein